DGIQGIATLKAFNANIRHRECVNKQAEIMRKTTMKNLVFTTANSRALELFIVSGKYIPLLFAVSAFWTSNISVFELILIFFFLQAWGNTTEKIMGSWLKGYKGISSLDDIFEIISEECGYSLGNSGKLLSENIFSTGDITFNDVTFSYQDDKPALKDISLSIKEGTETAIVGSSGSGKSTLAQLMFGFYKPQKGGVMIGEQTIDCNNVYDLQSQITVIWQDSHIFNDTCFNNIKMAKPDSKDEDVFQAAKKANIHDFIMSLPEQYNTIIGNGGSALSGGEKQRIIIARAFLRNSPILILDEATSSLDRQNEVEIQQCIQELSKGKTVMVIAHRFETIGASDQICLLRHGSLIAKGTHDELMEKSEEYRFLVELQHIRR
ncbi:MAG: ABC transporter ATP-binding protein/permease, partial [Oscillospiraceae bacterium]|nr:ABC transporter ATP-binding protein/permease [Oscillospiraceae bacterium]